MRNLVLVVVLVLVLALPAQATEIETNIYFGNIGFLWSASEPIAGTNFPDTNWNYGASVKYSDQFAENFSFEAVYATDPILRHMVKGLLAYQTGILTIRGGPILGVLNSLALPIKGGMTVGMSLKLPGIFFAEFLSEASLGAGLYAAGDYIQEAGRLAAGFYVPNAICTASIHTKKYYQAVTADGHRIDASTDYNFNIDVFKKGVPYRLIIDIGYLDLSRTYPDSTIDRLGSIIIGARVNAAVSSSLSVLVGAEASVFSFGMEQLALRGPESTALLFQAFVGCTYRPSLSKNTGLMN